MGRLLSIGEIEVIFATCAACHAPPPPPKPVGIPLVVSGTPLSNDAPVETIAIHYEGYSRKYDVPTGIIHKVAFSGDIALVRREPSDPVTANTFLSVAGVGGATVVVDVPIRATGSAEIESENLSAPYAAGVSSEFSGFETVTTGPNTQVPGGIAFSVTVPVSPVLHPSLIVAAHAAIANGAGKWLLEDYVRVPNVRTSFAEFKGSILIGQA